MSNPILKGFYADPDIACFDGRFYIYPTTDGYDDWTQDFFKVFSSDDLVNWKDEGTVLHFKDVPWTGGKYAWAPAIGARNGKYYLYYAGNREYIGVAVSDTPTGTFTDIGRPLIEYKAYAGRAIDPDFFEDEDGTPYLYWGNMRMHAVKLKDDMITFDGEPVDITPPNFREAPCVFKRKGIYYFTWSEDDTRSPDYHIRCGKGTSPMQKPEGNTVILHRSNASDSRIRGTGHHTILNVPGTDDWYIIYHRFCAELYGDVEGLSSPAGSHREVCIDRLEFDAEGNILPVKPTMEGVPPIR